MAKSKNVKNQRTIDLDLALALELQQEYHPVGITENAVFPDHKNKENYQPRTLIDQTLEIVDPTPNIHTLFMQFNTRFFYNKLLSVEVKWSNRMTSCAGVCSFHPRSRDCVISLSAPLLKLRPRKDLVETLLHEMIHGYLFLTNNNRDRDGHGPEFCKHMDRINMEAGTKITIYHSFHDEVKLYQQHWWRCNGPCQQRHPYFGMVRRAMNRAPGPSDNWWRSHQQNCGGEFIKVKEPEKTKGKSKVQKTGDEKKKPSNSSKGKNDKSLDDFFAKPAKSLNSPASSTVETTSNGNYQLKNSSSKVANNYNSWNNITTSTPKVASASPTSATKSNGNYQPTINAFKGVNNYNSTNKASTSIPKAAPAGLVKLGTATNRVHGWGTGGPGSSSGKSPNISKTNSTSSVNNPTRTINFAGTVGGLGTGRSNLLDKFPSPPTVSKIRPPKKSASTIILDTPPIKKPKIDVSPKVNDEALLIDDSDLDDVYNCPICKIEIPQSSLNDHLDVCLVDGSKNSKTATPTAISSNKKDRLSVIDITSSPENSESPGEARKMQKTTQMSQSSLDSYVTSPKKTATKHVPCPVCNKSFAMDLLNEHLDNCLTEPKNKENTVKFVSKVPNPLAGTSREEKKSKNFVDLTDESVSKDSYVCLVCNARISGDIALNVHLDDCVQAIFNDDSIDVEYNNSSKSLSPEIPVQVSSTEIRTEFPCPICMKSVPEDRMNEHLDTCLSGDKWD